MSYISLYRKYRPETFDSMIGQEHIVRTLKNQIKSDNIGHAYLFTGTRGTGKTSAAKIFARAVNCTSPVDGSPCANCKVCNELKSANNMDILEIDAASNNGVDEIRDIRDKVKYPPVNGRFKVYIVDEVHMLTTGAFNALLKTLEEPPQHIIFILATTEVHKLPQTILSRCMRFDFRLVSSDLIGKLIADIMKDMNKPYEDEAIAAISAAGEGSVRDALSIADMCMSYKDGKLTYQDVQEVIGASSPEMLLSLIKAILQSNLNELFGIIEECARGGKNFSIVSRDISNMLRNLIYIKNSGNADKILKLPKDLYLKMKSLADQYTTIKLLDALESLCKLEGAMRYSIQPRIAFEAALVRASISGNDMDNHSLARLKTIEDEIASLKKSLSDNNYKPEQVARVITKEDNLADNKAKDSNIDKDNEINIETKSVKTLVSVENFTQDNNRVVEEKVVITKEESTIEELDVRAQLGLNLEPVEEKPIFGEVKRINKGEAHAKDIIGNVIKELRKRHLYHLHGIFGYNDVKVWIEDNKYYIQTFDEYGYNQLTNTENHKIFMELLNNASDKSFEKLVILQPKQEIDISKSVETIKQLFDSEILNIKK